VNLPATFSHSDLVALVDTREQTPLDLSPLTTEPASLVTGDYSVRGLENIIAIERKSLPDLLACVGQERARFDKEMLRLLGYPVRGVVVESTWPEIEAGNWRSQVKPSAVVGSCMRWIAMGIPFLMAGDHARAGRFVSRMLFIAARRRYHEARLLLGDKKPKPAPPKETCMEAAR
jgi:DNA excision repair protein ERCC-4